MLIEKVTSGVAKGYGQHYVPIEFRTNSEKNTFSTVIVSGPDKDRDYILTGEELVKR